jgi:hypothetical protein
MRLCGHHPRPGSSFLGGRAVEASKMRVVAKWLMIDGCVAKHRSTSLHHHLRLHACIF